MREKIKEILREQILEPGTREEQADQIKKRRDHILKILPKIVSFFEDRYSDILYSLEVKEKEVHYGNHKLSLTIPQLILKFNSTACDTNLSEYTLRKNIWDDLSSFFNIDLEYYGVPLEIRCFIMTFRLF
jgi:hypothetical protein